MDQSFWDFSVRTYRTEGIPEVCLMLQDGHGVDVNMLLYCYWVAGRYGKFDEGLWTDALSFSMCWSTHVVKSLRSARTWMKTTGCLDRRVPTDKCMAFREEIKSVEFAAEKMQQDVLESLLSSHADTETVSTELASAIESNVQRYIDILNIENSAAVTSGLSALAHAAYPDS